MFRPLEGVRVLDLSRVLAGPYTAKLLMDLGATVLRVEAPWGDDTRGWGPPFTEIENEQVAAYWTCLLYTSPSPRDRTRSRMPSSA